MGHDRQTNRCIGSLRGYLTCVVLKMSIRWSGEHETTIPAALRHACTMWPHKTFLDFSGSTFTYADVDRESNQLAHGLAKLGVSPGDRICWMLPNVIEAIFVWFAINKLGAVSVPINTDLRGEYLRHQVANAGAAIVVVDADYADRIMEIADDLPELRTVLCKGSLHVEGRGLQVQSLAATRSSNTNPIEYEPEPADLAVLMYTSGTTGPSKGCMVSHNYACNFGARDAWAVALRHDDIHWTPCPLFHAAAAFGVVLGTLMTGATASIYPRFSLSSFWDEIERSRATVVFMLSIMLSLVPSAADSDASKRCYAQIRTLYGGPLGSALRARWKERFGVKYAAPAGYGLTEVCFATLCRVETSDIPDNASGRRFDDFDVRIIDDNGNECPVNVPGEIIVRPHKPNIMFQGYWRQPEATLAAMRDLWFHTGDLGKFDADDYFYFVDRKKDYLRRGGENISSFEVEATFAAHPAIAEVAAHSVLSDISEDELKVTLVLKLNAKLEPEVLCQWSIDRLPRFAVPRYIEFRRQLPKTATGRVQKELLRSQGVTLETWDRKMSKFDFGTKT